jgi:hypothetical protein
VGIGQPDRDRGGVGQVDAGQEGIPGRRPDPAGDADGAAVGLGQTHQQRVGRLDGIEQEGGEPHRCRDGRGRSQASVPRDDHGETPVGITRGGDDPRDIDGGRIGGRLPHGRPAVRAEGEQRVRGRAGGAAGIDNRTNQRLVRTRAQVGVEDVRHRSLQGGVAGQGRVGVEVVTDVAVGPAPGRFHHLVGDGQGDAALPAGHDAPYADVDRGQQCHDDTEDKAERDQGLDDGEAGLSLQGSPLSGRSSDRRHLIFFRSRSRCTSPGAGATPGAEANRSPARPTRLSDAGVTLLLHRWHSIVRPEEMARLDRATVEFGEGKAFCGPRPRCSGPWRPSVRRHGHDTQANGSRGTE